MLNTNAKCVRIDGKLVANLDSILELIKKRALKVNQIAKKLGLKGKNKNKLRKILGELSKRGLAKKLKGGKYVFGQQEEGKIVSGFIRKSGNLFFLDSEKKDEGSYLIYRSKDKLIEDALAVGVKKKGGCEIRRVFESLSSIKDIKEFVILKYGLPRKFGKDVEEEIKRLDKSFCKKERLDLRDKRHVTIDGENAKDFDDAVCVEKTDGGFTLYVSIADVGNYVLKGSALDEEAKRRGMSVYFPDSVIPMLPQVLSEHLCSLKPKEERLCFSVIMQIDKRGNLKSASFKKTVIKSVRRLTYDEVERAIIHKDKAERRKLRGLLNDLEIMRQLTELLLEKRIARGSLDFDLPEPEFIIDMEGDVKDVLRSKRLFSHKIIEEFMILANRSVAEFFEKKRLYALFRIHEEPEKEKLKFFEKFVKSLGVQLDESEKGIKKLQKVIQEVKGKEYEFIVNRVLLRSMKQARYSAQNKGHYGLGLKSYLHFTSPIRRYPDLVCHRILDSLIKNGRVPYSREELKDLADYLSERERVIMEVEREIEDRIRILFMKENIGKEYTGLITHITPFGFFVELFDVFVEGFAPFSNQTDDLYFLRSDGTSFVGKRKKKLFRLGDIVNVRVISADVERKLLRFILVGRS